eukprot:1395991-Pleurochrysis_carterae.AAC.1
MTLNVAADGLRRGSVALVGAYHVCRTAFRAVTAWWCCRSPPRPLTNPRASRRRSPAGRVRHDSVSAAETFLSHRGSSAPAA